MKAMLTLSVRMALCTSDGGCADDCDLHRVKHQRLYGVLGGNGVGEQLSYGRGCAMDGIWLEELRGVSRAGRRLVLLPRPGSSVFYLSHNS